MLDYIKGVSESVLGGDEGIELAFEVVDGAIVSTVRSNGRDVSNTQRLHRALTQEHGCAVGENLIAALSEPSVRSV